MAIFGITTRRERAELQRQIDALKAEQIKYQPWLLQTAEAEQWNMPDMAVFQNQGDLYRTFSPLAAVVGAVADAISLAPGGVFKVDGDKEPKAVINHEFELLLNNPNPEDSRSELLYATQAHYELNGNAVWWLNKANPNARADEIWNIPYHMIQPIPDGKMYLRGYMYYPGNGAEIFLEPWEIVHFRRHNQNSRFTGLSIVECLGLIALGDLAMQKWNTEYFAKNNARLPGIITFEQMINDDQWAKIKKDTTEHAKNREIMALRGTGAGGVKWIQNSMSQKDMEFLQGREANASEVYSLYPGYESMTDKSATEANANAGKRTFAENVIWPRMVRVSEKIVNKIFYVQNGKQKRMPIYEDNIVFQFEDPRITDRQLELQEIETYSRTHTVKEVREKFYSDAPLGDERDDLFIVQVKAKEEPKPEPKPETIQGQEPLEATDEPEPKNNALKADLDKWRRKALKKVGQIVPFESDEIPSELHAEIIAGLPACKTDEDVRELFAAKFNPWHAPAGTPEGGQFTEGPALGLNTLDYERGRYNYGKLLNKIKRFYQRDEKGIPHNEDDLFDLGGDLADVLEEGGSGSNFWKYGEDDFKPFLSELRNSPSVLSIDKAIDSIHQSFLESDDESTILLFGMDFRDYILNRNFLQYMLEKELNEEDSYKSSKKRPASKASALLVMQSIEAALKALDKQPQPVNVTLHNHPGDPNPIIVESAPEREQQPPIVNVTVEPNEVKPAEVVVVQAPAERVEKPKRKRKTKVKRVDGGYEFEEE